MKEYIKSLEDEIDWKVIDQLHTVTVNFSTTSLELKKLFFVLVGIAVPALIKLAGDKLNISLFITLYFLTPTFWFMDSYTYFYQEKMREKMNSHFTEITKRNKESLIIPDTIIKDYTIEVTRNDKCRFWRSALNSSVWFYPVLLILNTVGIFLFLKHYIG